MNYLLLNWHIFDSFYFLLNRHDFYFLFRDDFLVILSNFLDCIIILFNYFSGDCLHYFSFLIIDYFSSFRYHLGICSCLVIDHFFLIRNIFNSALSFYDLSLFYSWSSELTDLVCGESTLVISINARSCINMFIGNGIWRIFTTLSIHVW